MRLEKPLHVIASPTTVPEWRNRDRLKTAAAALVVCLRIGYDPPDVVKTDPCAKLQCWIDPFGLPKEKALEQIGENLQKQYVSLATTSKTRYRQHMDPSVDETRKLSLNLRKTAKNERVLFHYNGHGVPKPTTSGEIWVFVRFRPFEDCSIASDQLSLHRTRSTPNTYQLACTTC